MVAAFSVADALEDAIIFITLNGSTILNLFGSALAHWPQKQWSDQLEREYIRKGNRCSKASFGPYTLHFVELSEKSPPSRPKLPSVEILNSIVGQVSRVTEEQRKFISAVNGVIGFANARMKFTSADRIFKVLQYRFTERPHLHKIISHHLFHNFLIAKAYELAEKSIRLAKHKK